jgi:hypothetical protein
MGHQLQHGPVHLLPDFYFKAGQLLNRIRTPLAEYFNAAIQGIRDAHSIEV